MEHVKVKRLILSREGPPRHRHVPAEGREEPGQHRADRRHQLPQDRRVRLRLRPARVQLRRRAEHRQPRHRRVHRSAQARRGVPVRPARRVAGAHDQAEEVRPDLHRRGDPRPHERAGVQEAPGQRDDGGVPRPHHQDRRAVQHPPRRRDQDLPEGLRPGAREGHAHRPAHDRGGGDVGGADAPGRAEEGGHHQAAEAQALQRQEHPRLHRGLDQGAEGRGPARRHAGHLAALHPGQDLQRAGRPPGAAREGDQPVHGDERAGGAACRTTR